MVSGRTVVRPGDRKGMRLGAWLVAIASVLLFGTLIVGSMRTVEAECSLCVEYRGQRQCRTGSGATEEDARGAAQRAACAVMARGMNESIACQNTRATEVRCGG